MSTIVADQVSKMWTPSAGLRPVDLSVAPGELLAVRGRSGTGKSTLLALLSGLCRPDSGYVTIDGRAPHLALPWSTLALVPQVLGLALELSIAENVADAVSPGDRPQTRQRVAETLAALDLTAEAGRTLDQVSMGQLQRAAIARAVVAHPLALLGDEPTSFQDGGHTAIVVDAFRRCARAGSAVVIVTHDPVVAAAADRVIDLVA
jgi:putative ABC transport system ATP-binding protein